MSSPPVARQRRPSIPAPDATAMPPVPVRKGGRLSMQARAAAMRRVTMVGGRRLSGRRLSVIDPSVQAQAQVPQVSLDVMNTNFEEWMKMATDNKINATNSWSFALIDYFHDMSLLRNELDNSINFQKASCTLDGCVKIWTSRIDSVDTETKKLLSGLRDDVESKHGRGDGVEGGEDDEDGERRAKRKMHRAESTLSKTFEALQIKKFDLEFTVDPLFKKTSADFDEGGAGGLLMNHLGVDERGRVVFDASDVGVGEEEEEKEGDEEQVDAEAESEGEGTHAEKKTEAGCTVNIARLRSKFLPTPDVLTSKSICPSLSSFRFSSDPASTGYDPSLFDRGDEHDFAQHGVDLLATPRPGEPGQAWEDIVGTMDPDYGDDDDGAADFFADVDVGGGAGPFAGFGAADAPGLGEEGDAALLPGATMLSGASHMNERDLVMSLRFEGDEGEGGTMFDYFDQKLLKNWAGPEHWKMKKAVRKDADPAEGTPPAKKTRTKKEPFEIDFSAPPKLSTKELLEPGTNAQLYLPTALHMASKSAAAKKKRQLAQEKDYLLPDDMHFNSQQLLRLFLKPKVMLYIRRRGSAPAFAEGDDAGEVDERFWSQAAQGGVGVGVQPTASQPFFNDDTASTVGGAEDFYDQDDGISTAGGFGPGTNDDLASIIPGSAYSTTNGSGEPGGFDDEDDLTAGGADGARLKRVRPEFVKYAKRAKKVDVRKLKETIWRELKFEKLDQRRASVAPAAADPDALVEEDEMSDGDRTLTQEPSGLSTKDEEDEAPRAFDSVLTGLRKAYPREKMQEISTSFCFICLLHLANEEGLKISAADGETGEEEKEKESSIVEAELGEESEDRPVGRLEKLTIVRDREAERSE